MPSITNNNVKVGDKLNELSRFNRRFMWPIKLVRGDYFIAINKGYWESVSGSDKRGLTNRTKVRTKLKLKSVY